jgi:hypothetical protein
MLRATNVHSTAWWRSRRSPVRSALAASWRAFLRASVSQNDEGLFVAMSWIEPWACFATRANHQRALARPDPSRVDARSVRPGPCTSDPPAPGQPIPNARREEQ